jgi:2',3'-cyclic-nucleotide 2'-phosphodiesterase (5'-nucleotidase family)
MKKTMYLLFALLAMAIWGCKPTQLVPKDDGIIDITLLHINDVYEIAPLEGGKVAGMARVATLKKRLLAENPNTFLLLSGDFLSPSIISSLSYEGERIDGKQMVDVMNHIGVDFVTFGNHEFDVKEASLLKRLNESQFRWVSANVLHQQADGTEAPFQQNWNGQAIDIPKTINMKLTDKDGTQASLGLFGITIPSNPKPYVAYKDFKQTALSTSKELANSSDLIVAITHIDELDDIALAKQLPQVLLFAGGHDHTNMYHRVANNYVAKADANAKTAYVHHIRFNTKTKISSLQSDLVKIDSSIPEDAEIKKVVDQWQAIAAENLNAIGLQIDEIIADLKEPLDGLESSNRHHQTNMGALITAAMQFAAPKSEAVFVNSGSIRIDDLVVGSITPYDVFRMLPFGGGIVEVEMKGELLRRVLAASQLNKGKGGYLQLRNIEEKEEGKILVNGKPLEDARTYRFATSDFMLRGLEANMGFFSEEKLKGQIVVHKADKTDSKDYRFDIRKAIVEYLKSKKQ